MKQSKPEPTNDLFVRATLLASDEQMKIQYRIEPCLYGEITLSHNVTMLSWKTQRIMKQILNQITPYIFNYYIESIPER